MNHRSSLAIDLIKFCHSDREIKQQILTQQGLQRYSQLLCQLTITEGNLSCLARFFSQPDRQKFPQLQHTDLTQLDLNQTNMIRANFTGANLQGCSLQNADIIFGNFTQANLTNADLSGSTLHEATWKQAIVTNSRLINTKGITPQQQLKLAARGAIFEL
jgi:uncharacterized protein YjbI with pentapeptide repeats